MYKLPDGSRTPWFMSGDSYIKQAISAVNEKLGEAGRQFAKWAESPVASGYRPEVDLSPVLNNEQANYYQNLIGVLRWAVELGCIDIYTKVALLSQYIVQP